MSSEQSANDMATGTGIDDQSAPSAGELTPADEELATLLSEGISQNAAGEILGVSSRTVRRRLKEPGFRSRVDELRRDRLAVTTARLVRISDSAVDALEQLLDSEDDRLRLRTAQTVLSLGRRHHREETIEMNLTARMEEIERVLDEVEGEVNATV